MPLIFMHLPKTGGTTVSEILRGIYPKARRFDHITYRDPRLSDPKLRGDVIADVDCVLGHYRYGIHDYFDGSARYFTMLRDPVERVLSMYSYHRANNFQPWVKNATLSAFLERHENSRNGQTKQICGDLEEYDARTAKARLLQFDAVGITEYFEDSIAHFKHVFDWPDAAYRPTNITPNRVRQEDVSSELLNKIRAANAVDLETYAFAKSLFMNKMAR